MSFFRNTFYQTKASFALWSTCYNYPWSVIASAYSRLVSASIILRFWRNVFAITSDKPFAKIDYIFRCHTVLNISVTVDGMTLCTTVWRTQVDGLIIQFDRFTWCSFYWKCPSISILFFLSKQGKIYSNFTYIFLLTIYENSGLAWFICIVSGLSRLIYSLHQWNQIITLTLQHNFTCFCLLFIQNDDVATRHPCK